MTVTFLSKLLYNTISWCLGLLDYGFLLLKFLGPKQPKFFQHGYGDVDSYHKKFQATKEALENGTYQFQLTDKIIDWGKIVTEASSGVTIQEAYFRSPCANELPKAAEFCRFHLVRPVVKFSENPAVYVIMLPATGEMGRGTRMGIARHLAQNYGWCSVLLTAPYYSIRKPKYQSLFYIDSVKDLLWQSMAIIEESSAITDYLLNRFSPGKKTYVCNTGFSFGGAMSACATNFALMSGADGKRLACAPYVGSASPLPMVDGMIQSSIAWDILEKIEDARSTETNTKEERAKTATAKTRDSTTTRMMRTTTTSTRSLAQKRLFDLLNSVQMELFRVPNEKQLRGGSVKAYATLHDQFVLQRHSVDFERQIGECLMMTMMGENQEDPFAMQWIPGGHVFGMLMRPKLQTKLIVDAVQELLLQEEK